MLMLTIQRRAMLSFLICLLSSQIGCDDTNTAPELLPLGELLSPVNTPVSINIYARDQEEDTLQFSFTFDPLPRIFTEGELGQPTLTPLSAQQAIFQWVPSAGDVGIYSLTITVTDPDGLSDQETLRLEIYNEQLADQARIRFIEPMGAGQRLDLAETSCLEMRVAVSADGIPDDDILIDLDDPAVEGAALVPAGLLTGKQRQLLWCPSPEQQNTSDRYTLTLRARRSRSQEGLDTQWSEGIRKRFLIMLEDQDNPDQSNCVGRPPTIAHTPPRSFTGLADYPLEVTVNDDFGIKSPPLLALWVEQTPPPETLSDPRWSLSEWKRSEEQAGLWEITIPNLNLAEEEQAMIYYGIIVTDNDDPQGARCDHTTESSIYALEVTGGSVGGGQGLCQACSLDDQCGSESDLCLAYSEGGFCGRACDPMTAPCDAGYDCMTFETPDGRVVAQCVPDTLSCLELCLPDRYDMTDLLSYDDAPFLEVGLHPNLVICEEPYDLYQLQIPSGSGLNVQLDFNAAELDLDLAVALGTPTDENGNLNFTYESASADQPTERISLPCAQPNGGIERAWVLVVPYQATMSGGYQLSVTFPQGGCATPCLDDELENSTELITDGFYQGLTLCAGDLDRYRFEVPAGWVISALIEFELEEGDLDLALFDDRNTPILSDRGARPGSLIEWRTTLSGEYTLEVSGADDRVQNRYSLDLYFFPTDACQSTQDCSLGSFCYAQLGCLDDLCAPDLGCGEGHTCLYPPLASTNVEGACAVDCLFSGECRTGEQCKVISEGTRTCVIDGTSPLGSRCSQHSECTQQLACVPINNTGYCLHADCETTDCQVNEVCERSAAGSYCLPSCDAGCPQGWRCSDESGIRACRPE